MKKDKGKNIPDKSNPPKRYNIHSSEVQEVMGKVPPLILRCGISIIVIIFVILFVAGYTITYPYTLTTKFTLSVKPEISYINIESSGKLVELYVESLQEIASGDTLAAFAVYDSINDKEAADTVYTTSSVHGKLFIMSPLQKCMFIPKNETIFAIVPIGEKEIVCTASLPTAKMEKIKLGQEAHINLSQPDRENVPGNVSFISPVPDENGDYIIGVNIICDSVMLSDLVSNPRKIEGEMSISLGEKRIIEKIFPSLNI